VAHWLRDRGFDAYAVQGGLLALLGKIPEPVLTSLPIAQPQEPGSRATAALRHPLFRRYSTGVLLSLTGNWIEAAAFGYVVLLLGGSAATLGLIGFLNTIPNLIFGLPAGALADRYDRRKLLLIFQSLNGALAAALAVLYATGNLTVGLMGALAVVGGTLGTLSFPAFQGMLAATVPGKDIESAVAINSLSLQVARFVGPAIAGYLLAAAGPTWVFSVNAVSFLAVLGALLTLPRSRASAAVVAGGARLGGAIMDGVRYMFGQRSLASLIILLILAGLFATPPVAFMIPAIVRDQLDAGAATLGLMMSAIGLGSVLGSLALLKLASRANKGEPAIVAYLVTAAAIAGVGLSPWVSLSLVLAVVGGFFGVVFIGLSTVVVQTMSSDEMRARAMAVWAAAFVGVLPIGALITGGFAAVVGAGGAVFIDGLATLVGGVTVLALRPEVLWLGCAALPESCVVAISPVAALEQELAREAEAAA
jgi:MFS family permease